jgi:hypothetical protein
MQKCRRRHTTNSSVIWTWMKSMLLRDSMSLSLCESFVVAASSSLASRGAGDLEGLLSLLKGLYDADASPRGRNSAFSSFSWLVCSLAAQSQASSPGVGLKPRRIPSHPLDRPKDRLDIKAVPLTHLSHPTCGAGCRVSS